MRGDHEIMVLLVELQVVHRRSGEAGGERRPRIAVIDGIKQRGIGAGDEETFLVGVFAHDVYGIARRQAVVDSGPGDAEIVGAKNVGLDVVALMAMNRTVSR